MRLRDAFLFDPIPDWMGAALDLLVKAAGHKYIRREPTGNPRRPWRYFYRTIGKRSPAAFDVGAAFRMKLGDKDGHFHVVGKTDKGLLQVRHDETGHVEHVPPAALVDMMHRGAVEHRRARDEHEAKTTGPLLEEELHEAAKPLGGGKRDPEVVDKNGKPAFVPNNDPTPLWNEHRLAIADRVGDVGDEPSIRKQADDWINANARTAEELHALAEFAKPSFIRVVRRVARHSTGAEASFGDGDAHAVKTLESLQRKVAKKVDEDPDAEEGREQVTADLVNRGVGDALRGTILVEKPEQIAAAVQRTRKEIEAAGGKVVVDNKWRRPTKAGYVAVHADVHFPTAKGPIRAEIQFHPREHYKPKHQADDLYGVTRETTFTGDEQRYRRAHMLLWLAAMRRVLRRP